MKAEDLMVGDWVSYEGEPIQVQNIQEKYINDAFLIVGDNSTSCIPIDKITPIPLTEEILHKNGFKNDVLAQKSIIAEGASNFSVILISEDNRIVLNNIDEYLNSFNNWSVHIDTEDMRTMSTSEITYVHEFQHVLRLCEIEKEIMV